MSKNVWPRNLYTNIRGGMYTGVGGAHTGVGGACTLALVEVYIQDCLTKVETGLTLLPAWRDIHIIEPISDNLNSPYRGINPSCCRYICMP